VVVADEEEALLLLAKGFPFPSPVEIGLPKGENEEVDDREKLEVQLSCLSLLVPPIEPPSPRISCRDRGGVGSN
jgi:hypothetical protein